MSERLTAGQRAAAEALVPWIMEHPDEAAYKLVASESELKVMTSTTKQYRREARRIARIDDRAFRIQDMDRVMSEEPAMGDLPIEQTMREATFSEIDRERQRQDAKWGFPRNDLSPTDWIAILAEEVGEAWDEGLSVRFDGTHLDEFIKELVQAAAVAVAIIEHYGRGGTREQADE